MNNWNELAIKVSRETQEAVSNILIEAGAQGVAIEDTQDYLDNIDKFGEILPEIAQLDTVVVKAYYPENLAIVEIAESVKAQILTLADFGLNIADFTVSTQSLAENDWSDNWKQYFLPTRISHDLTIVPSWTDYVPVSRDEKIIRLDPGMAFGTGTHPTTKLSLFALAQTLRGGETLLDVGTGSGVLSIAANLLGACEIHAFDLDDVAVKVACENIQLNPNMTNITVKAGDLLKNVAIKSDVIVANILADILMNVIDDAYTLLNDGGFLIMSGIIDSKSAMILEKCARTGFALTTQMQQGEWHCVILQKAATDTSLVGG
ncbi:ribosomal protein L11 methyltransferase [Lactococcus hodotermopsidis]|uniref:Ribosomal protein L11 methyltransferase n=1 Tax=Pseudolactococcus hodotermopsidis TaxID=2709157 RepID=A0A6A0BAW5_9LACT|nr:50S ribosomal protein L11 methyltransferase [Lactococcus hodotermopsidis]GFH41544.1 ribosomal protein L11 methyltransferase [Lactococcus hodotermopsidis]